MPSGGGQLQLIAQGKQDIYLTGNPQTSFFKFVYRRHTNFSIESMPMYFDGTPNFGQRIVCTIPRRGDLLGQVFLDITLPQIFVDNSSTILSYVNSVGHALIQEISIEVGEQEIDKQTGEYMEIWTQLTTTATQRDALNVMLGRIDTNFIQPNNYGPMRVIVPLQFWFCKTSGNYLPLIALQYHPVRIVVKLRNLQELFYVDSSENILSDVCTIKATQNGVMPTIQAWGDFVYLDVEERRKFVEVAHEYLIDQVQYTSLLPATANTSRFTARLDFNHPMKELLWVVQRNLMRQTHEHFNWSSFSMFDTSGSAQDNIVSAVLQFDGQDRFDERDSTYFRIIQPYQHHTTTPVNSFIYNYSFALKPEDVQPSGSANASRMDSIVLNMEMNQTVNRGDCMVRVYARNMNIFRVIEGFGGLLFKV